MGFSISKNSKIIVTDNDNIEISNLNRQFLFNKKNIGESKSKCACLAIKQMNSSCNFEDMQLLLDEKSENIFNSSFWKKQNYILNAVDNIKSRQYIDSKVTLFKIPLIETATEGLKAHCQIIIPYLTQSYSEREYNKELKPIINTHSCTLKQFPYLIEHCIQWGKLHFEKYFNKDIENLINIFIDIKKVNNELSQKKIKSKLNRLKKYIWYFKILEVYNEEKDESKLIELLMIKGIEIFYKLYNIKINSILNLYPIDYKQKDGSYFWSGSKRAPKALEYDINDELSFEFVKSYIILLLKSLNMNLSSHKIYDAHFNEFLKNIFNQNVNNLSKSNAINSNKLLNNNKNINEVEKEINQEIKVLDPFFIRKLNLIKNKKWFKIELFFPIIFEKDNDSNYHIEFINACSNLRARNYKIDECTKLNTKLISGNIIPSISSTTATIVGYGCCSLLGLISNKLNNLFENNNYKMDYSELYKKYDLNLFHELRFNLAENFYLNCFPPKAKIFEKYKILNVEYINYKKYKLAYNNKLKNLKENTENNNESKKMKIKKYIHIIPKPEPFSIWDNLIIDNSYSFNELKDYFKNKYKVNVNGIYSLENKCLIPKKELFDTKIETVLKDDLKYKKKEFILFKIDANTDKDDIIKFPTIKYNLFHSIVNNLNNI